MLGGLADLFAATNDTSLLEAGTHIADAVMARLVVNVTTSSNVTVSILSEPQTISAQDGDLFKGIFMRNLGRFADAFPVGDGRRIRFRAFIAQNVRYIQAHASTPNHLYGGLWQGPVDAKAAPCKQPGHVACGNATGAVPQISALLLLAA